jgi:hypothetical protein
VVCRQDPVAEPAGSESAAGHRLIPLPGRGSEGSSWAELADDGDRFAIAGGGGPAAVATTPHPTMADNSDRHGPLPLASSGELDPIPDPTTVYGVVYRQALVQMDRQFGTKWTDGVTDHVTSAQTMGNLCVYQTSFPSPFSLHALLSSELRPL